MMSNDNTGFTEDEAALYDRQIRLWGLDAQNRLRAARALLVGVSGLGAEVAKNIVLSGVKSLTLLDHEKVSEEDACYQFLVDRKDIGKNRAAASLHRTQQLNTMVNVTADTTNVADKKDEFFLDYDVIIVTCCRTQEMIRINNIAHDANIMFFAGDIFGYFGYMFADLKEHTYAEESQKKKQEKETKDDENESSEPAKKKMKKEEMETVIEQKHCSFTRLKNVLSAEWDSETAIRALKRTPKTFFIIQVLLRFRDVHGRDPCNKSRDEDQKSLLELSDEVIEKLKVKTNVVDESFTLQCFAELSPVCAIVGGILGQEVIKAVSQKDKPHNNLFFFNGLDGSGMVDKIGY